MFDSLISLIRRDRTAPSVIPPAIGKQIHDQLTEPSTAVEYGMRATPENAIKNELQRHMWVDPDVRQAILDMRDMDRRDPRVKRIHSRTAGAAIKGGLRLKTNSDNKRLIKLWTSFAKRCGFTDTKKLKSHVRGFLMEGNLPIQWLIDNGRVVGGVRMPSETIRPHVNPGGTFIDPNKAYIQYNLITGQELASFPLWKLSLARLDPDNYDDHGCLGRPYLDATRSIWKKLVMTEEDVVIRRRTRSFQRTAHVVEGATHDELMDYKLRTESDEKDGTNNYYMNKKGGVSAIQGDANLDQMNDVIYLLDSFLTGTSIPKGLLGYASDLSRDILEDLKKEWYDELDEIQDAVALAYELGFKLELLLNGINPDNYEFSVCFAERRTETPNQAVDRSLKLKTIGASQHTQWEVAGLDPSRELEQRAAEAKSKDPYPDEDMTNPTPRQSRPKVSITPGNAPKGESATSINNN